MGRVYSAAFENVSVSGITDLFGLEAAASGLKPCRLLAIFLSNAADNDAAGDAKEEFFRLTIKKGHTTNGSGGSTYTPVPVNPNDTASSLVECRLNATTIASGGTSVLLHADGFNNRAGYIYLPLPEMRHVFGTVSAEILVVRLEEAPITALNMNGTIYFEELF